MNVGISRAAFDQILDHADRYPGEEVCGLLLGDRETIMVSLPAANVATDRSRHFELDPAVLLSAHKAARAGGPLVLGHYHSHPSGRAMPSEADAEQAYSGPLWLIVADGQAALFQASEGGAIHGFFEPRPFELL